MNGTVSIALHRAAHGRTGAMHVTLLALGMFVISSREDRRDYDEWRRRAEHAAAERACASRLRPRSGQVRVSSRRAPR